MAPTDDVPSTQDQVTVSPDSAPIHAASPMATASSAAPPSPVASDVVEPVSYASSATAPVPSKSLSEEDKFDEKKVEGGVQEELGYGTVEHMTEQELRESKYLTGRRLALVFTGMLLAIFLVALDQTILAPALPVIAGDFQALDQIAWIASSYFLTQCAFLLLYGQVLTVFDRKLTFLFAIALFEIGSLICGLAPNVDVLIFGRAFAGVGAAGLFVSVLSIISDVTRLEQRPKLFGLFGGVFALASVIGPLLGGKFTDTLTWRWCFYINLPFGVITVAAVCFILGPTPPPPMTEAITLYTERKIARWTRGAWNPSRTSIAFRLMSLDWIGTALLLVTVVCLLLPLQWGGAKYAWSDPIIIGVFVCFGALVVMFVAFEWFLAGESCILPMRFFRNRSQVGASLEAFFLMFVLLLGTYYLPIFFQATKGATATTSGINILPFMLGVVFAAGGSGGVVSAFGRYKPFLVFGPTLICIGSGLLYTIDENSSNSKLIGYQIILALGVGSVLQNTIIAVQADIANENDISQATGIVTFAQLVGGTIGIAIASTIFGSQLVSNLALYAPDAPLAVRLNVGLISMLPVEQQAAVIHAYVKALNTVFIIGVPAGALASLSAMLVRDLSVKGKQMMGAAA